MDLIDVDELAQLLNLKKSYIYKLVHQRRINHYKPFGGKIYFDRKELLEKVRGSKVIKSEDYIKQKIQDHHFKR